MDKKTPYAWKPSKEIISNSNLLRFMKKNRIKNTKQLCARASSSPSWFWKAVVEDMPFDFYKPYKKVLELRGGKPWAKWFVGGKTNLVHNALDRHIPERPNQAAIIWEGENGETRTLTYYELWREVNGLASALKNLGIQRGDRVGIFMPMLPETAVALFAVAKIGAIFTPIFSGYGAESIATRLNDCEAKLLFTADGFYRRGQVVPMKQTADEAVKLSPTVQHVVVVRRLKNDVPWQEGRDKDYAEITKNASANVKTEIMDAQDPFMLIYTSGTTGRPKGTVHVHTGFPLKGSMDMRYGLDLHPQDTLFWFTDIGWMMGPWEIIGALTLKSTMFFYEGAPDFPQPDRVWDMVERHGITALGISPTLVRALMKHGDEWVNKHEMPTLRILGSTGETWNPDPWWWCFKNVGRKRCPIINYSGGTEISGGILMGNVLTPLKPCAFSGPVPGMDADVVDAGGKPVREEVGELVVRQPWPGMTSGFWKDPDRYLETYWSRFPDLWVHGDWCSIDKEGLWYIHGRSDDTIKVAGKRVGPAEVESVLVGHPAVAEAAAIGVPDELKGENIVCFAVLKPGNDPSEDLRNELRARIEKEMGKALRPKAIKFVKDLPKTRNAKIMRRLIRARFLGQPPGDTSSLENPDAVEEIGRAV